MASSIFQTTKKLRNMNEVTATTKREGLFSRIRSIGNPNTSLIPVLDHWVQEGRKIYRYEFRDTIRILRKLKRHNHALEFCEWISGNRIIDFAPSDCALELGLIGEFHGVDSALRYFNGLSDEYKTRETCGALLNCYVQHREFNKALLCFRTIKNLGLASVTCYSGIMSLYVRTDQAAKIPSVIAMMNKEGVSLDQFCYRIWMNSYTSTFDGDNVEKILQEIKARRTNMELDWRVYDSVANFYIKAGQPEKSLAYLKKSEKLLGNDREGYTILISQYGKLGKKDEMMRLWGLQRAKFCKQRNKDYAAMLGSLVKLGEVEETERLVEEWESSCEHYDFQVLEVLLLAYCQKGSPEKAEARLNKIIAKGKSPIPSNWATVAAGYMDRNDMGKALECIERGLVCWSGDANHRLSWRVPMAMLNWLAYNGGIEDVEGFVRLMRNVFPVSKEMYYALITVHVRMRKEVGEVLERMRSDGIDADEETERLLRLYSSDSDM